MDYGCVIQAAVAPALGHPTVRTRMKPKRILYTLSLRLALYTGHFSQCLAHSVASLSTGGRS